MSEVRHLSKSFGNVAVFHDLSVKFRKGETAFVLGRSGVGKSVLLKHLVGLLTPDAGSILVDDNDIVGMGEVELTAIRKKCGMVFQFPALLDSLTVYENISFGIRAHRLATDENDISHRVMAALRLVRLSGNILEKYPPELSFGIQKRTAIARTLAIEPAFLLFDEPTTGMDPITTRSIGKMITHLKQTLGIGAVVVTHDIQSAMEVGDRIIMLDDGKSIYDGTCDAFHRAEHPLCQTFLREGITHE